MIKANELRIDNWIKDEFGRICLVFEIRPHAIRVKADVKDPFIKNETEFSPIPLTEEWLLRFGFIPSQFTKDGFLYTDNTVFTIEPFGQLFMIYHKAHFTGVTVEFLHQIQNFFALTGQELALTPKMNEV